MGSSYSLSIRITVCTKADFKFGVHLKFERMERQVVVRFEALQPDIGTMHRFIPRLRGDVNGNESY